MRRLVLFVVAFVFAFSMTALAVDNIGTAVKDKAKAEAVAVKDDVKADVNKAAAEKKETVKSKVAEKKEAARKRRQRIRLKVQFPQP